jgi:hypothetical protein
MEAYDPKKNYFGAEGTKLADIFGEILKFMPALKKGWNRAAYYHDLDYTGTRRSGFWGRIQDFFERRRSDTTFYDRLVETIITAEALDRLTEKEGDRAMKLAKAAYLAVRVAGWKPYKKGNENA